MVTSSAIACIVHKKEQVDWPKTAQDMGQTVGRGVARRRGPWSEGYSGRIGAYVGSLESPMQGLSRHIRQQPRTEGYMGGRSRLQVTIDAPPHTVATGCACMQLVRLECTY